LAKRVIMVGADGLPAVKAARPRQPAKPRSGGEAIFSASTTAEELPGMATATRLTVRSAGLGKEQWSAIVDLIANKKVTTLAIDGVMLQRGKRLKTADRKVLETGPFRSKRNLQAAILAGMDIPAAAEARRSGRSGASFVKKGGPLQ
ncbi:MAG: hypothetical protein ABW051_11280, partial [Burkholderiaceae bacterium]